MGLQSAGATAVSDLDPNAFTVRRLLVRDDVTLAYVREGSGVPLVLLHGWPETMRIWWRNIAPLAAAGFDVIVPDLRGFGGSSGGDGFYDLVTHSRDIEALLTELGVDGCIVAAGDWGGGVAQDLASRRPDLIERLVLFNTLLPPLHEEWERAGVPGEQLSEVSQVSPHMEHTATTPMSLQPNLPTRSSGSPTWRTSTWKASSGTGEVSQLILLLLWLRRLARPASSAPRWPFTKVQPRNRKQWRLRRLVE